LPLRLLLIGLPLTLLATAICPVLLSVLLHGLSANPLAVRFNRTKKKGAG
jgi:NhaP-type Na+/H+ or K+/H+ antiporter